jgi:hypothetical protein
MSKKLDYIVLLAHVLMILVLTGIMSICIFYMVIYMSLNNWDIRCIFVECKPVKLVDWGEE